MLDDLDRVVWGDLTHAYGRAGDVPGMLRRLLAVEPGIRDQALHDLTHTIAHQGSVYAATVAAVPFLVDLAAAPSVLQRDAILRLLAWIAAGYDGRREQGEPANDEDAARLSYEAVRAGLPIYLRLLADDDNAVRRAVLEVLLRLQDEHETIGAHLRQRAVVEPDDTVLAEVLQALGAVGVAGAWYTDLCARLLATHPSLNVRLAAASMLLDPAIARPPLLPAAVRLVAQVHAQPSLTHHLSYHPPYIDIGAGRSATMHSAPAMACLGPQELAIAVPILLDGLETCLTANDCRELVEKLVSLLHRHDAMRQSTDHTVHELRCRLTRQTPLLGRWLASNCEEWTSFQIAETLVALVYEYATVEAHQVPWLDDQRAQIVRLIARSPFWRRNNFYIIRFTRRLLDYLFAASRPVDVAQLPTAQRAVLLAIAGAGYWQNETDEIVALIGVLLDLFFPEPAPEGSRLNEIQQAIVQAIAGMRLWHPTGDELATPLIADDEERLYDSDDDEALIDGHPGATDVVVPLTEEDLRWQIDEPWDEELDDGPVAPLWPESPLADAGPDVAEREALTWDADHVRRSAPTPTASWRDRVVRDIETLLARHHLPSTMQGLLSLAGDG